MKQSHSPCRGPNAPAVNMSLAVRCLYFPQEFSRVCITLPRPEVKATPGGFCRASQGSNSERRPALHRHLECVSDTVLEERVLYDACRDLPHSKPCVNIFSSQPFLQQAEGAEGAEQAEEDAAAEAAEATTGNVQYGSTKGLQHAGQQIIRRS